jgi:hypothetical protein
MKYKLLIDIEVQKYQPQFFFSKILDIESVNVRKFNKVYLYIDDLNIFYSYYNSFDSAKVIYLYNKNIVLRNSENFDINIINCDAEPVDIKDLIIGNKYIKDYLNGVKNND